MSPKSVLLDVKLPDLGDERMRLGAAITDSSHNNPGVFASGPLPQIQSVLLTLLGQNLTDFQPSAGGGNRFIPRAGARG